MAYFAGKKSYVGIKRQAVAGTAETTATIFMPVETFPTMKTTIAKNYAKEFRGHYAEVDNIYVVGMSSAGDISMAAYPDFLTYALYGVFGTVSSSVVADAAYTHTITTAETLPIWTVFTGTDTLNVQKFPDQMLHTLQLSAQPGSDIQMTASFSGSAEDKITTSLTPTYGTQRALHYAGATVSIAGGVKCDVDTFQVSIDRGLQSNKTMCTTGIGAWNNNMQYPTTLTVDGSFDMYFQDYGEYEYWLGKTGSNAPVTDAYKVSDATRALVFEVSGALIGVTSRDKLTLTVPSIVYDDSSISRSFDDRVKVTFNFKGVYDTGSTSVASAVMISKVINPST